MRSRLLRTAYLAGHGRGLAGSAAAALGIAVLAALTAGFADDALAQMGKSGDIKSLFNKAEEKATELTTTVTGFVRVIGVCVIIVLAIWAMFSGWNRNILAKLGAAFIGLIVVYYADDLVGWMVTGLGGS